MRTRSRDEEEGKHRGNVDVMCDEASSSVAAASSSSYSSRATTAPSAAATVVGEDDDADEKTAAAAAEVVREQEEGEGEGKTIASDMEDDHDDDDVAVTVGGGKDSDECANDDDHDDHHHHDKEGLTSNDHPTPTKSNNDAIIVEGGEEGEGVPSPAMTTPYQTSSGAEIMQQQQMNIPYPGYPPHHHHHHQGYHPYHPHKHPPPQYPSSAAAAAGYWQQPQSSNSSSSSNAASSSSSSSSQQSKQQPPPPPPYQLPYHHHPHHGHNAPPPPQFPHAAQHHAASNPHDPHAQAQFRLAYNSYYKAYQAYHLREQKQQVQQQQQQNHAANAPRKQRGWPVSSSNKDTSSTTTTTSEEEVPPAEDGNDEENDNNKTNATTGIIISSSSSSNDVPSNDKAKKYVAVVASNNNENDVILSKDESERNSTAEAVVLTKYSPSSSSSSEKDVVAVVAEGEVKDEADDENCPKLDPAIAATATTANNHHLYAGHLQHQTQAQYNAAAAAAAAAAAHYHHYGWHAVHHAAAASGRGGYPHPYAQQQGSQQPPGYPPYHHPYWAGYGHPGGHPPGGLSGSSGQQHPHHAAPPPMTSRRHQRSSRHKKGDSSTSSTIDLSSTTTGDSSTIITSKSNNSNSTGGGGGGGKKKRHRDESSMTLSNNNNNNCGSTISSTRSTDAESRDERNNLSTSTSHQFSRDAEEDDYDDDEEYGASFIGDEHSTADDTEAGMSLGGLSFGSLGRIPHVADLSSPGGKRRKGPSRRSDRRSQTIHRAMSHSLHGDDEEENLKLLGLSSTLSDGKSILNNLSINSSYSAEFADLCRPSPTNAGFTRGQQQQPKVINSKPTSNDDKATNDRTPKKRNTVGKWRYAGSAFRIDTNAASGGDGGARSLSTVNNVPRMTNSLQQDDSPTMFDLIGGAETPTTGMLMHSLIDTSGLSDDIRSLNGHLRGQSFTPLPMMTMVGDHRGERGSGGVGGSSSGGGTNGGIGGHHDPSSGHSLLGSVGGGGGHGTSPQLSWDIRSDGESPLGGLNTPRFRLDSTKSGRSYGTSGGSEPLGSPKGFWKDSHLPDSSRKDGMGQGEVKSILSLLSPTMREMNDDMSHSGTGGLDGEDADAAARSTSPLPLYYDDRPGQENKNDSSSVNTPLRIRPPVIPNGVQSSSSPYPPGGVPPPGGHPRPVHMHGSPWGDYCGGRPHNGGFAPPGSQLPPHAHHPHHPPPPHGGGAASPYPGADGHPAYHHHPPQGMYHHPHLGYNPNDRVRNLRGNGPPRHQLPPQHHLPPPSYHHFSPLTNVMPGGGRVGGRYGGYLLPAHLDMAGSSGGSSSKRKCIPIKPPIPSKFQGDIEIYKDAPIPEFNNLVNFPGHMSNKPCPNIPDGMRCCVMCGQACPCSMGGKTTKKINNSYNVLPGGSSSSNIYNGPIEAGRSSSMSNSTIEDLRVPAVTSGWSASLSSSGGGNNGTTTVVPLGDSNVGNNNKGVGSSSSSSTSANVQPPPPPPPPHQYHPPPHLHHHVPSSMTGTGAGGYANIPTQNKGLCTICDVNVWIVASSGLEIKWCKGCKNFRPWAAFGDKGLATKCVRCRERQREKYALQKEEKDKKKSSSSLHHHHHPHHPHHNSHHHYPNQQQVRKAASSGDMSCDVTLSSPWIH